MLSVKSPLTWFQKKENNSHLLKINLRGNLKKKKRKKKMVHIVLSFRANLLHGSLETRRANWFLRCSFISSNGTNKQEMREGGHWWGWMEENGRRRGESGGDNSSIRECCMDSHHSLKPKSERFHSKWKLLYVGSNNSPCDGPCGHTDIASAMSACVLRLLCLPVYNIDFYFMINSGFLYCVYIFMQLILSSFDCMHLWWIVSTCE